MARSRSRRSAFAADRRAPERAVLFGAARVGEDHGQGHLAVAEIVADALAHHVLLGRIVEHVVDQLEGDAEVSAVLLERQFGLLAGLGDDRGDAAGGGEQSRGLGGDDREILLLAGLDPALRGELLDLALGDHRRGVAEDLEHPQAAVLDHQLEGAAEQEIADQHARRIAPDEVGGALAAAKARAVDDVVVEQGRGVDELDRGGELLVAGAAVAEQRSAAERQHRPHALAAAGDQVAGELRDQRDLALHPLEDDRVDAVHVVGDQRHQRVERRRG